MKKLQNHILLHVGRELIIMVIQNSRGSYIYIYIYVKNKTYTNGARKFGILGIASGSNSSKEASMITPLISG